MKHTAKPDTNKGATGRDQLRRPPADTITIKAAIAGAQIDGALTRYGLTVDGDAHRISGDGWTFDDPACPWHLTAELYQREDEARLMDPRDTARSRSSG